MGPERSVEILEQYYGTLDRTMLSLFETISEGIHWGEIMDPLVEECSAWLALVFIIYIFFAIFLLMNVITGMFCTHAMETAEIDRKQTLMQQMCQMFVDLDDDGSGTVTWNEFEEHLANPQMVEYLKIIDLDPHDAK